MLTYQRERGESNEDWGRFWFEKAESRGIEDEPIYFLLKQELFLFLMVEFFKSSSMKIWVRNKTNKDFIKKEKHKARDNIERIGDK